MAKILKSEHISIGDDGLVVLADQELVALERDFAAAAIAGGSNGNCTNAGCSLTSNLACQNSLCGDNANTTCVNIGGGCHELSHQMY